MKNTQFKLPCGCNFCSLKHLEKFFKHLVGYKLKYNYKCICAYEYKPYQILELCDFLRMNKTGITTNNANNLSNEKIVKVDINKKTNTAGFLRRTAEMPQLCHLAQVVLPGQAL